MTHSTSDNESTVAILRCIQAISKINARRPSRAKNRTKDPKISPSQARGMVAEATARDYLIQAGLQLIHQNYRLMSYELDLIMLENHQTLVFVEVRLRNHPTFVSAAESICKVKQHKLIRAAQLYLQRSPSNLACRFDIIAINSNQIEWIKDAFSLNSCDN